MPSLVKTSPIVGKGGREGRAVKVSKNNYFKVAQWSGGEHLEDIKSGGVNTGTTVKNQRVKLKTKAGIRVAKIGDIVVKWAKNEFTVVKAEDFEKYIHI